MPTDRAAQAVSEIDALLARAGLRPGEVPRRGEYGTVGKSDGEITALTTSWVAAVERLTLAGSPHREMARRVVEKRTWATPSAYVELSGVLNALRSDLEAGYLATVTELVHADVFGDFLEMAAELLGKGYKDPAAVVIGSVLEEHLRKLAAKHGIPVESDGTPRKADTLNADLKRGGIYNNLVQKDITARLDLRNKAAHGHYDEYDSAQVRNMLDGVRTFLISYPA